MTEEKVKDIIALESKRNSLKEMQYFMERQKDVWWEIRSSHNDDKVDIPLVIREGLKKLVDQTLYQINKQIENL